MLTRCLAGAVGPVPFVLKRQPLNVLTTCATEADMAPEMVLGPSPIDPWSPDALRQAQAVDSEVGEIVSWRTSSTWLLRGATSSGAAMLRKSIGTNGNCWN